MSATYGHAEAQELEDPQWIHDMTERGLVLLSKDARIKSLHLDAVVEARAGAFLLPDQGLTGDAMVERFVIHRYKIASRAQKRGPYIYMVGPKQLTKVKLPPKYPSKADGPNSPARKATRRPTR